MGKWTLIMTCTTHLPYLLFLTVWMCPCIVSDSLLQDSQMDTIWCLISVRKKNYRLLKIAKYHLWKYSGDSMPVASLWKIKYVMTCNVKKFHEWEIGRQSRYIHSEDLIVSKILELLTILSLHKYAISWVWKKISLQ